ncbi:MAG: RagB/SusD family nutrient uptake outer membrane protein [Dysgonamonadaceae bacterium]|nr:RagB/SusD family nutrient uptake outer membrane protein [Dysgonamonadaceae bacterium]
MNTRYFKLWLLLLAGFGLSGCADYLDIMPDNVATIDHAFANRESAQRFLFSCYNYLPNHSRIWNPGMVCGDEVWWCRDRGSAQSWYAYSEIQVALGNQTCNDPSLNFWDGSKGGKNMFIGIRDCNIFLENIHVPTNMEEWERKQWIAEVKFLKAYFHYYLLQLYGPVPIVRENLPVDVDPGAAKIYREPVDDVVNYIVGLIDEALPNLMPSTFETRALDAGRITKPIAAALKAKALTLAASPLFNGNADYAGLKDNRGVQLISQEYDVRKWERAAEAAKEAIAIAMEGGHGFYQYQPIGTAGNLSPATMLKCTLRGAITEKFNPEIIWPSVDATNDLETQFIPFLDAYSASFRPSEWGPTLKAAEQFYTKNGLPVSEDAEWITWAGGNPEQRYDLLVSSSAAGSGINGVSSLSDDHKYYIKKDDATAKLHFYREPRFYAWVGFDRSIWELNGKGEADRVIYGRMGEISGVNGAGRYVPCGYYAKKLVNMGTVSNTNYDGYIQVRYTYPIIRLTDLLLLCAEALNESKARPDEEVYQWIDMVRNRAGIPGVMESYAKAVASARNKPVTKEGMREIIKRERMIELSFESQRFFDLMRWKDAMQYFNEPVKGWNIDGKTAESYYKVIVQWDRRVFNTKDYLWPLRTYDLQVNANLVQNPGW